MFTLQDICHLGTEAEGYGTDALERESEIERVAL